MYGCRYGSRFAEDQRTDSSPSSKPERSVSIVCSKTGSRIGGTAQLTVEYFSSTKTILPCSFLSRTYSTTARSTTLPPPNNE